MKLSPKSNIGSASSSAHGADPGGHPSMTGTVFIPGAMAPVTFLSTAIGPGALPFAAMTKHSQAVIAFPTMSRAN